MAQACATGCYRFRKSLKPSACTTRLLAGRCARRKAPRAAEMKNAMKMRAACALLVCAKRAFHASLMPQQYRFFRLMRSHSYGTRTVCVRHQIIYSPHEAMTAMRWPCRRIRCQTGAFKALQLRFNSFLDGLAAAGIALFSLRHQVFSKREG